MPATALLACHQPRMHPVTLPRPHFILRNFATEPHTANTSATVLMYQSMKMSR